MTDDELEAPAHLGRTFPIDADPVAQIGKAGRLDAMQVLDLMSADARRDRSLGYMVMLSALLVVGALAYAGEGWWLFSALCAIAGGGCTYGAVRRARRRVREEMDLTSTEPGTARQRGSAPG